MARTLPPAPERRPLDATGFWMLFGLSFVFAINNLFIKIGTEAFHPVVMAGLRSAIAVVALTVWMLLRGLPFRFDLWRPGLLLGACFATEFFLLFIALDLTTLVRAAILFYAMPLWTAGLAHFLFPGERLTPVRATGFLLGFSAVVLTLVSQAGGLEVVEGGNLVGDLIALSGGFFWALIVVVVRRSRLSEAIPETQLFWQLLVSAPLLLAVAPIYGGDWFRAVTVLQVGNLVSQALFVAAGGFLVWFWLLRRYPSGSVASFGFLTPALSVILGWALLNEPASTLTPVALVLLAAGLWLINRR